MDNLFPKVSIIIPVYNVEDYLKECLDSIINQTLKEIEIICIDDCSTDGSYLILKEYEAKDSRFRILKNKENCGSGPTRNIGIREAKGEYIGFVDSDDFVSHNYFETLYNTAKKYNSNLVNTLNIYELNKGKERKFYYYFSDSSLNNEYISETNILNFCSNSKYNIIFALWNKIYDRKFIIDNNLYFLDNKYSIGEDADFNFRFILNNPSISFNNNVVYYYRIRSNSLMQETLYNIEASISSILHMNNTISYCKENRPDLLSILNTKIIYSVINTFTLSLEQQKRDFYPYIHDFIKNIYIDELYFNNKYIVKDIYEEYLIIKDNDNYDSYLLDKNLFSNINKTTQLLYEANSNIDYHDSWSKIFGIKNTKYNIIIFIFGIKIVIKKS